MLAPVKGSAAGASAAAVLSPATAPVVVRTTFSPRTEVQKLFAAVGTHPAGGGLLQSSVASSHGGGLLHSSVASSHGGGGHSSACSHGGGGQLSVCSHGGGGQLSVCSHGGGGQLSVCSHGGGDVQPVCAGLVRPMPWLRSHS